MSNVVEQLTPNPVNHELGENGCCPNPRAWEMEMMHQVWAAGLHDAANCFQSGLEAKWKFGVNPLVPTNILTEYKPLVSCFTSRNKGNRDKAGVSRKGGASKARSKFSPGIAAAMADQWGGIV